MRWLVWLLWAIPLVLGGIYFGALGAIIGGVLGYLFIVLPLGYGRNFKKF